MTVAADLLAVRRAVQRLRCQRWLREAEQLIANPAYSETFRVELAVLAAQMREAVCADEEVRP